MDTHKDIHSSVIKKGIFNLYIEFTNSKMMRSKNKWKQSIGNIDEPHRSPKIDLFWLNHRNSKLMKIPNKCYKSY